MASGFKAAAFLSVFSLVAAAPEADVTLYKISDDECGQATLDEKYAGYAKAFAGLSAGTCASRGYTVADGFQTLNVPVLGKVTIGKFKKAAIAVQAQTIHLPSLGEIVAAALKEAVVAPATDVTLYKIVGDECGQATLDEKYAKYAKTFAGLTEGTCASHSYADADGSETLSVPVLGKITISKFKKSTYSVATETLHIPVLGDLTIRAVQTAVGSPDNDVTLYKISGGECGQATLDEKYAKYAKAFAGLADGNCASQGYTVVDGTQSLNVPVLGKITIAKFKKATLAHIMV